MALTLLEERALSDIMAGEVHSRRFIDNSQWILEPGKLCLVFDPLSQTQSTILCGFLQDAYKDGRVFLMENKHEMDCREFEWMHKLGPLPSTNGEEFFHLTFTACATEKEYKEELGSLDNIPYPPDSEFVTAFQDVIRMRRL